MGEWFETTLGKFVGFQRGHDLPQRKRRPGSVPVIGSGGITGYHDTAIVDGPGVTVGRAANLGVPQLHEEAFWPLNTTLYVTDFNGNHPRFTYHLLQQVDLSGFNSGSVQPMLNRNYITQIPIYVPYRPEQDRISTLLGALDDKIAVNERVSMTYEDLLSAEFLRLELDYETDDDTAVKASSFVEFNPRIVPPKGDNVVYLDMAALPTASASVQHWTYRTPKSGSRFTNGDTVLSRITPCLENGKTAYVDFMEDGEVGVGSTEFIVMRAREGVPSQLPYFLARSPRFRRIAIRNMVGSSGRQRVSAEQLAEIPIVKPDPEALAAFGASADRCFKHMRSLVQENLSLAELRDTLLPKLMSGEIRVRDAEKAVEEAT